MLKEYVKNQDGMIKMERELSDMELEDMFVGENGTENYLGGWRQEELDRYLGHRIDSQRESVPNGEKYHKEPHIQ